MHVAFLAVVEVPLTRVLRMNGAIALTVCPPHYITPRKTRSNCVLADLYHRKAKNSIFMWTGLQDHHTNARLRIKEWPWLKSLASDGSRTDATVLA